ncbi:MAG: class I SAM-dependent methyltransferase [Candidatus Bathyarchaeota archaeon]|nr:class I SAM-dependent methyltransferase [Candidatus Bathyarchaeota archaeon]
MSDEEGVDETRISTLEWYDFIGLLVDVIPALHLGGTKATEDLLEMCQLGPETRVLDIGCGGGQTACKIAREYGSQVVGIDISEVMISKAKENARDQNLEDRVEFRVADVFQLPFDDESFDVALFESVLTPLPGDKLDAMRETLRVIKPGGLVGVNESIFYTSAPAEFLEAVEDHPAMPGGMFTPQKLRGLFEDSGLQVVDMTEVRSSEAPSVAREMGVLGILSFMIKNYWKILHKLLTDPRFRKAQKVDDRVTKILKDHGGYMLIVGQKTQ